MANRCTPDDVRAIMPDTALTDPQIEPYITSAHVWVDSLLLGKYTEEVLFEIERWMSAHMIAYTAERMAEEEEAGGARIEYTGDWGSGLMGTPYGQMVLQLDYDKHIDCLGCGDGSGPRKKGSASIYAVPGN